MTRAIRCLIPTIALLATFAPAYAEGEPDDGQMAYNNACRTCHSFKAGDNRLGPSLHGVVGRKAGSLGGFEFSSAMKTAGIVWDEQNLDKFIADPEQVVHGNKMKPYGGIDDAAQRAKIVAYLQGLK